ncbi:MAG: ABC transporter substrate-binding protein [Candidatus Accumulibacter sp.]|jgi:iron complex transport system substrate-binding protein|nr:ABC transporter substrate-binding protein [Accumulibacter sp.]
MKCAPRLAAWCGSLVIAMAAQAADTVLPSVVSTNVCADALALSLADDAQLLSVSAQARDPRLSPLAGRAARFPINHGHGALEEILEQKPDVVLISSAWRGRRQAALLQSQGIALKVVPFPLSWEAIFADTRRVGGWLGREDAAEARVADVQRRLQRLKETPRPFKALHVRPNGRCAGKGTQIDRVFEAAGVTNHADALGCTGWGQLSLEKLLADPPDFFVVVDGIRRETAHARSFPARHPLMRQLMERRSVIQVSGTHWGCSNWLLIEAAEEIAAEIDRLTASPSPLTADGS